MTLKPVVWVPFRRGRTDPWWEGRGDEQNVRKVCSEIEGYEPVALYALTDEEKEIADSDSVFKLFVSFLSFHFDRNYHGMGWRKLETDFLIESLKTEVRLFGGAGLEVAHAVDMEPQDAMNSAADAALLCMAILERLGALEPLPRVNLSGLFEG